MGSTGTLDNGTQANIPLEAGLLEKDRPGSGLTVPNPLSGPLRLKVPAPAPLASRATSIPPSSTGTSVQGPGQPRLSLAFLQHLLRTIAHTPVESLRHAVPALQILSLAVAAGVALKLTGATLHAIDELPLLGGLLELVGLVSLIRFLSRNALRQQKRAELLARIEALRRQLLG